MNKPRTLSKDELKELCTKISSEIKKAESSVEYSRGILPVYRNQLSILNSSDNPQKDREDAFKERIAEHELRIEHGQEDALFFRRMLERIARCLAWMEKV